MNQALLGRRGLLCGALCAAALMVALAAPLALAGSPGDVTSVDSDYHTTVPGTSLVGDGNVQVETGVAHVQTGSDATLLRTWATPTMVRFGMPNNYEIRVLSNAYSHVRTNSAVTSGVSDLTVGLKSVVPQTISREVSLAVVVQAAFPSGSSAVRNNGVRPELQMVGQWQLPNANSLGGVAGIRSDVDAANSRFATGVLGMNYMHTWNAQLSTYGEMAARTIRTADRGGKDMMWDIGAAWRPMAGTQLNVTFGKGLKKNNDTDTAWTIGISQRFRPMSMTAMSHKQDEAKKTETPSASSEDGK